MVFKTQAYFIHQIGRYKDANIFKKFFREEKKMH